MFSDPFLLLALVTAIGSALLLLWYLFKKPALTRMTKVLLLFGIGILPIATATNGNVAGYNATKTTKFCASSCHVMVPYGEDSWNDESTSLAARHARNDAFGNALQIQIEGSAQCQIRWYGTDETLHVTMEEVDKVICARRVVGRHPQRGRLSTCAVRLLARNGARLHHRIEHQTCPLPRSLEVAMRSKG